MGLFYRQVVAELRKVIWPTRRELVTYTTVVLVFVAGLTVIVAVLDARSARPSCASSAARPLPAARPAPPPSTRPPHQIRGSASQ